MLLNLKIVNAMETKRFFKPFIGDGYSSGINGQKVLVIGASFYCANPDCKFYNQMYKRRSPKILVFLMLFVHSMSLMEKQLHNEPSYCVEETFLKLIENLLCHSPPYLGVEELNKFGTN